jgi:hypothetical protein
MPLIAWMFLSGSIELSYFELARMALALAQAGRRQVQSLGGARSGLGSPGGARASPGVQVLNSPARELPPVEQFNASPGLLRSF